MDQSDQREEALFGAALALPVAERAAFLERECAGDAELRRRVEALLRAHETVGDFLEAPPAAALSDLARVAAPQPPPEETVGTRIGRYKLLQKIGEGGFGMVYMAEQEEPVQRRVALKVIRLGMDTKEVIARFEAERQALALMDHPNIARVFDAGATEAGRPYFVMELVRGIKITDYCDQHNLPTAERLHLFTQVCHAIQHAHQKGVIHRDIKPSNILVTLQDGEPVPKVIDFGIAKAAQGRLTDQTLYTAFEQFIGTPAYMSPEQAELTSQDVDTRSDIYSLGVLLYELLTGHTPFETKELLKAGLDEIRRYIREVEPPKPSTRLSTLSAADRATVAKQRGTVPARLSTLVRGDLDWIAMRCLEKNRARRYETANALALDLDHHLRDEPVTARPPTTLYRVGKLVRRHKLGFAAASTIASALVFGLAVSTWMFLREKAAREQAVAAEKQQVLLRRQADAAREQAVAAEAEQRRLRQQAEESRQRAVAAEEEQGRQRQQAEQARDNEAKQRAQAEEARASEEKQRAQAEADRKKAETEEAKSNEITRFLAEMLQSVGPSVALGRDTTLLREILDKTAARVGSELKARPEVEVPLERVLAETYYAMGDYERSEALLRTAQSQLRATAGAESRLMSILIHDLAAVRLQRGDFAGAETLTREALALRRKLFGNEDPAVAASLGQLSVDFLIQARVDEAEAAAQEALAISRKSLGNENLDVASDLDCLSIIRATRGDLTGAEDLTRQALAIRKKLGGNRYEVTPDVDALAMILDMQGDENGAEGLYREELALKRKVLGDEDPDVASTLNSLGELLVKRRDLAMAEIYLREALAIERKQLGAEHPAVAQTLTSLAGVLIGRHDLTGAEALLNEALVIRRKAFGNEHPILAGSLIGLAVVQMERGNWTAVQANLSEGLALQKKALGNDHPRVAETLFLLAGCSMKRGDWPSAEAQLTEVRRIASAVPSVSPRIRDDSVRFLAVLYERWAKTDPTKAPAAAQWKQQAREIAERNAAKESALRAAANQIKYANTKTAESAVLQAIQRHFTLAPTQMIRIIRIDGALIETGWFGLNPFKIYVSPGRRRVQVGVTCNHFTYFTCAKETVEVDFQSRGTYNLTTKAIGDDFDLMLWDESKGIDEPTLVMTWRLSGNRDLVGYYKHLRD